MQGIHLRKYGVAATIDFELYEVDGVNFRTNWTPAAGDVFMMRDEAAEEQVTNAAGNADLSTLVTDEGRAYSITLALEDMQAARVVVYLVDQATKVFLDKSLVIETYGNASAQHAFDLDTAMASQTVGTCTTNTDMAGTDNAALASVLGAAVGASISADIADLPTVAEFEARTIVSADYVVVGDTLARVTLVDTTTTNTDMVGTDNALLAANVNVAAGVVESNLTQIGGVAQSAVDLKDFADAGYDPATNKVEGVKLVDTTTTNTDMVGTDNAATEAKQDIMDTNIDQIETAVITNAAGVDIAADIIAVKADTAAVLIDTTGLNGDAMVGTDNAALASVCTEGRLTELDAANIPTDIAAIPTTAMRGTDNAALASVCTEGRLAELDAANLPTDIAAIPTTAMRGTDSAATEAKQDIIDTNVDSILVDTAEIGAAGAGLTNINLPNQTMDITGNLSGSVGSVAGAVGSVTGNVGGNVTGAVGSVTGNVGGNVAGSVGSLTGHTNQTADHTAGIAAIPTVAEFNARTLASADYVVTTDTIAGATTVTTLTGHTAQTGDSFARLGAPAGASVSADIAAVKAVDDAIKVVTDNLADSATTIVSGTVSHDNTAATTTVFYSDDITEATADHYKGREVIFTSGAVQNQATDIIAYALVSGEGKFTVTALADSPADNVTFAIV